MRIPDFIWPQWLRDYPRRDLGADITAGVLVSILVVPQSLAYALLAGLPPHFGLYASIFPVLVYAWFGSSRVQAVGPVAITAIMTYTVLLPLSRPGSPEYIVLAATLSLLSGAMVFACGLARLGFLSQLLSRPVASGFISGSAVLIVCSQFKHLLGLSALPTQPWTAAGLVTIFSSIHGMTALVGGISLLMLMLARTWLATGLKKLGCAPATAAFAARLAPLVVVALGSLAVYAGELDRRHGLAVVGNIAGGLPLLSWQLPDAEHVQRLIIPALTLALIGMVQNISMAQALAVKRGERVDANRELVGLGLANITSAFAGGMPVGGGVSRSAVNVASGAQTPLASMVAALVTIFIVLWASPWLAHLPLATLAASIMLAAWSMVDLAALRQAMAYDRADALAWLGTALGVIVLGVDVGIGLGVVLSMATLLFHASTPHMAVVGRLPGSEHFRNVARHRVDTLPHALFLRIDESLFFGNLAAIESYIRQALGQQPVCHDLVLVMNAVNRMDSTAVDTLAELNRDLLAQGIRLHFAEIKGPVQDRLQNTALWRHLSGQVFLSASAAFDALAASDCAPAASNSPA